MAHCIYCGVELEEDVPPPDDATDEMKLLWRHPDMQCPELGEITFQFTSEFKDRLR